MYALTVARHFCFGQDSGDGTIPVVVCAGRRILSTTAWKLGFCNVTPLGILVTAMEKRRGRFTYLHTFE
jgi:hypothetical protein